MKNICVFTGTRAEYGLLSNLITLIDEDPKLNLTLIVSGTHLAKGFGETINEIIRFYKGRIKKIFLPIENGMSISSITALAIKKYSNYLEKSNFDLVFLLGDRYEAFAMASSAFLLRIPIAHIHGGETTLGAFDNALRHSISHMSKFHFVSNEVHLKKITDLGADTKNALIVGPMVLDRLILHKEISKTAFEDKTGYIFSKKNVLISFHSETLSDDFGITIFENLLTSIEDLLDKNLFGLNLLATFPNADTAGEIIRDKLIEFSKKYNKNFFLIPSLGHDLYINALKKFDCLIGNSSSGIIEAPLIGVNVINLGNRQKGRNAFGKVIYLQGTESEINRELRKILSQNIYFNRDINLENIDSPSNLILDFLFKEK